jgi:dienelactone hydrolase
MRPSFIHAGGREIMIHHKTRRISVVFLIALSALLMLDLATAAPSRLIEEDMSLPARYVDDNGSAVTLKLEAIVMRPDDDQRHPLILLNHEYRPDGEKIYADHMLRLATEFARRGMISVVFTRRGFGLSEGRNMETFDACDSSAFLHAAQEAAKDQREVIRLMQQMPYVDGSKIFSLGFSGGALGTLALSADPPPGLVAALNLAGGRRSSDKKERSCYENSLAALSSNYGRQVRIPMLWLYVKEDDIISLVTGKSMYQAFVEAGGHAEFSEVSVASVGLNGHALRFPRYISVWLPYVDDFLARQNLLQQGSLIPLDKVYYIHHPY